MEIKINLTRHNFDKLYRACNKLKLNNVSLHIDSEEKDFVDCVLKFDDLGVFINQLIVTI